MRSAKITITSLKSPFESSIYTIYFSDIESFLKELDFKVNQISVKKFSIKINNKSDFDVRELDILSKQGLI
jgi:hypothetical protein